MTTDNILFDDTEWPLLLIKHPAEPVGRQQTLDYIDRLAAYFEMEKKLCLVYDMTTPKPPTPEHRLLVASWTHANKEMIQAHLLGTAYIMPSLIQRLALTTFLKFMDTSRIIDPVEIFSEREPAMHWARTRISSVTATGSRI